MISMIRGHVGVFDIPWQAVWERPGFVWMREGNEYRTSSCSQLQSEYLLIVVGLFDRKIGVKIGLDRLLVYVDIVNEQVRLIILRHEVEP